LHVSLNLLTYLFLRHKRPEIARWLIWIVPIIVASTLLVKQHLVLDCVAGLVMGGLAFRFYLWLEARFLSHEPGHQHAGPN
ncbi:MAG: phosphatase PAP2 family protein, partial [Nevskiales bacterium]